jgi:nucleotide-binding universal stress UspA family protein
MILRPSVLCPIDFSESSRGALRYAGAVAAHFGARLTLLAVNDPLLDEAAELSGGAPRLVEDTHRELQRFYAQTFTHAPHGIVELRTDVATGKPAPEILRASREGSTDLIVMSSHGSTGFRKLFFGSTTERVLRETTVPVLVTPGGDPGQEQMEDIARSVRRVLVPVDLSAATAQQLEIARGLADALIVPVLLLHVIEPVRSVMPGHLHAPHVETERRDRAERELDAALAAFPVRVKREALIAYGEPAEEIAKVAVDRDAGVIVMGLHSSPVLGPRMGSVTYRVLCLAHRLVLALPPLPTPARRVSLAVLEANVNQASAQL